MKRTTLLLSYLVLTLLCGSCGNQSQTKTTASVYQGITLPTIPIVLNTPEERADYLAGLYWDNFDFTDTTLLSNTTVIEQDFVNFISILAIATKSKADEAIKSMFVRTAVDTAMQTHFIEWSEKYLNDPNSLTRNEDLYISVLECIISSPNVEEVDKIRPRYHLEIARKNRPGSIATDITYTLINGTTSKLSNIKADYTILFFNRPDCHDCARVKGHIINSQIFTKVKILAIYPDEELSLWKKTEYPATWINGNSQSISKNQTYDVKATPTIYLLDKDKRVILKDVSIEEVERWLVERNGASSQQ